MTKEELEYNRGYRYGYERGELNGYNLRKSEEKPCEDAISRELVIKYIKEKCNPYGKPSIGFEAGKKAIEYFKSLPPVTPTQKWIPVSERLPENETCVLTTIKIPNRIARVRSGWYDSGFIHNDNGDVWKATDMEVLAWMPLPKPYKESEKA